MNDVPTSDTPIEINPVVPPKQYLLMVDDVAMVFLAKMMPGIQYVEVIGMPVKENPGFQVLLNPMQRQQENAPTPDSCCPPNDAVRSDVPPENNPPT